MLAAPLGPDVASLPLTLAAGVAAFVVGALLARLAPAVLRLWSPAATAAVALVAAAGALLADSSPTGLAPLDALLRAALGAALVVAATRGGSIACLLAAVVVTVAAGGAPLALAVAGAAAAGLALALAVTRVDSPLARALIGAAVVQLAVRLTWPTAFGATALVATLAVAVLALSALRRASRPGRQRFRWAAAATVVVVGGATLLGLLAALVARPALEQALTSTRAGLAAARRGDRPAASRELAAAGRSFGRAERVLDAWWARPARAVPVVSYQARALHDMADAGALLAATGARTVSDADPAGIRLAGGALPLDRIAALRPTLQHAFRTLVATDARLTEARSPWLAAPIAERLDALDERVARARRETQTALLASEVVPTLLGRDGPRRYFLAIQTPAELRATGGIIGNFGEITAEGGRLRLTRLGRSRDLNAGGDPASRRLDAPDDYLARYGRFGPERVWQNVNASPDFPTVARVIGGLYPQSGGQPVDGVFSVDPIGLAALLSVVGPVEVPGWPEPLTAENAARVMLHEQYLRYQGDERVDFLGEAATVIWQRFTTTTLPGPAELGRALAPAVRGGHVLLTSFHPDEQRLFDLLGATGRMGPVRGDYLGVVNQNASGNKIDWFLRRRVDYQVRLDPETGDLEAGLDVELRNLAPAQGLPPYVIDSAGGASKRGENKTFLSIYTPWDLEGATLDGQPLLLESARELGRNVYSGFVVIPPGASVTVHLELSGAMDPDDYRLDVFRQPLITPDTVTTSVVLR